MIDISVCGILYTRTHGIIETWKSLNIPEAGDASFNKRKSNTAAEEDVLFYNRIFFYKI